MELQYISFESLHTYSPSLKPICAENGDAHRVQPEWQWPLSGVHSTMMEKLVQPGAGGECTPSLFRYAYLHIQKVVVYAPAESADRVPYFYSTSICTL